MKRFEPLGAFAVRLGESPIWDARRACAFFVDIEGRRLHQTDLDGAKARSWAMPDRPTALGTTRSGPLVLALGGDVVLFEPETARLTPFASVEPRPGFRLNDGKVGPDGAFWVGSLSLDAARPPLGALYRVTPDGAVATILAGVRTPNGLAWSPAGDLMYFADSRAGTIDTFAFSAASGSLARRRQLYAARAGEAGRPDGAAVDATSAYWTAWFGGGALRRFTADGAVESIPVPAINPTMPCFCGQDLSSLLVTTMPTAGEPSLILASGIAACGLPPHPFGR